MTLEVIEQREKQVGDVTQDIAGDIYKGYVSAMGDKKASQMTPEDKAKAAASAHNAVSTTVGGFLGVGKATWAGNATLTEYANNLAGDPRAYGQIVSSPFTLGEGAVQVAQGFQGQMMPKIAYGLETKIPELQEEVTGLYNTAGKPINPEKIGNLEGIIGAYRAIKGAEAATSRYA